MYYNTATTVEFFAIDTATGKGKTGDGANFTLRWVKDGTSAALTGGPAITEVDATNEPGLYKVTLAAADCACSEGTLHGKSSTTGIELIPRYFSPARLPNADPATSGGLPTIGTGAGQVNVDGAGNVIINDPIKKNVALNNFQFVMTDSVNHAPKTSATGFTLTRNIDGAGFAAGTIGSVTEVGNGWYKVNFGAGDLNGTCIAYRFQATGCDDLDFTLFPQP